MVFVSRPFQCIELGNIFILFYFVTLQYCFGFADWECSQFVFFFFLIRKIIALQHWLVSVVQLWESVITILSLLSLPPTSVFF